MRFELTPFRCKNCGRALLTPVSKRLRDRTFAHPAPYAAICLRPEPALERPASLEAAIASEPPR